MATESANPDDSGERKVSRTRLLIDVLTFQLKLIADGLRDMVLFPVAAAAAIFGVLFGGNQPDQYFQKLMRFGRETDRFINLFGQHDPLVGNQAAASPTADELLAPYQQQLLDKAVTTKAAAKVSDLADELGAKKKG